MADSIMLTARFQQVEGGWTQAQLQELPGVITTAATLDEAKELLVDALREYLLSLRSNDTTTDTCIGDRGQVEIVIRAA